MRIKQLLCACALTFSFEASGAESDWIEVTTSDSGSSWQVRADDVLNTTNKNPHVWIKVDASKDKTVQFREQKIFAWIDCNYQTVKIVSSVTYASDGAVLRSTSTPYASTDPIVPDTVMDGVREAVCPR